MFSNHTVKYIYYLGFDNYIINTSVYYRLYLFIHQVSLSGNLTFLIVPANENEPIIEPQKSEVCDLSINVILFTLSINIIY